MKVLIADNNESNITKAQQQIADISSNENVKTLKIDVSKYDEVERLSQEAFAWGTVTFVMNNAAIGKGGGTFENLENWRTLLDINLFGVINGVQAFVPQLIKQGKQAIVVNTGSKQGITNPPGNGAYNVSKSAVKTLTEHLSHELRSQNTNISAHLLIPGYTWTGMTGNNSGKEKPSGAWTAEQVADFLLEKISAGDFYILCPDNDVTRKLDEARMEWTMDDIIKNRSALSRWDPKYKEEFEAHIKK